MAVHVNFKKKKKKIDAIKVLEDELTRAKTKVKMVS